MDNGRRVVVIDGLPETEQVLKAVLEPRGFAVSRTRGMNPVDTAAADQPPQLLVLHRERQAENSPDSAAVDWPSTPAVIIGNMEFPAATGTAMPAHCRLLSHPFHYAELLKAIDRLLERDPDDGISENNDPVIAA